MLTPKGFSPLDESIELKHVSYPTNLLRPGIRDVIAHGVSGSRTWVRASNPDTLQRLYLEKNRHYLQSWCFNGGVLEPIRREASGLASSLRE